ncbi:similar to Saccharomyces cerevisiae YLR412W BER1 Protein involved in microtubule-related processes, N-acetylation [Maudiozyma saulgeensis]|uniref:Similar to Saccharomyces cerevisiae YLR412W BER1 Protein involved in microtubule-related processes, N-acetylation n=1 Tax=Maudiozyma saulgeensis TaxID=1789683 RepID=A0A1X7RAK4_9SACH|nr:similar to Saccharomyces cerevisiae YLR412W BER1 Protein involved in microtubule-related processes, N-acetylation [Kazachstania saulgeensis]
MNKQQKTGKKIRSLDEVLQSYRDLINGSEMFSNLKETLSQHKDEIHSIRCLAIGSFTQDFPAKYQIALLLELIAYLQSNENTIQVSIYDPVFNGSDLEYLVKNYPKWETKYEVDKEVFNSNSTLFFLPHAPLDLTEQVLQTEKPKFFLANNIIQHTDRYTKGELNEKYPLLSKLVHLVESKSETAQPQEVAVSASKDGFEAFVPKRKRKQKSKYKLIEKVIDFDSIQSTFTQCTITTTFEEGKLLRDKPWVNSFSDLAMHII